MSKIVKIDCLSCSPYSNECACEQVDGVQSYDLLNGIKLTLSDGRTINLKNPISITVKKDIVIVSGMDGKPHGIDYKDTAYNSAKELAEAVCACSASQSGGGSGIVYHTGNVLTTAPITVGATTYPAGTSTQTVLSGLAAASGGGGTPLTTAAITVGGVPYPIGTPLIL